MKWTRLLEISVILISLFLLIENSLQILNLNIDTGSIILIILILLSPLSGRIRKIKFKDFETEIDSAYINKMKSNIPNKKDENINKNKLKIKDIYLDLLETDVQLALAKLRIDIETQVNRIAKSKLPHVSKKKNLRIIIDELSDKGIIQTDLYYSLNELIIVCNKAIHGEKIEKYLAKEVIEMGAVVLNSLGDIIARDTNNIVRAQTIEKDELDNYHNSKYEVTTVIPYVEAPKKNVRILSLEQFDELLVGYDKYAEFIIDVKRIDNKTF